MSLKNFKSIGDSLSQSEFNGLISLYRNFINHSENLKLSDAVKGSYGKYLIDIPYAKIVDNGFLITNETLQSEPKIKLVDNVFKSSTYMLNLYITHYTGVNIFDDETYDDFKVVDKLEIELTPDTWVDIPLEDIEAGYILSFDAEVTIAHDRTEIQGNYVTGLGLSVDKSVIQIGEDATLNIFATDLDTLPVANKTISLYDGGTLLDNLTTDTTGTATKTITGTGTGRHEYIAKYKNTVESQSVGLLDTYFYDKATVGNHRTDYTNSTGINVTYTGDGTTLTETTGTNNSYILNFTATDNTIVEFTVERLNEGTFYFYYKGANSGLTTARVPKDNTTHLVQLKCSNGAVKLFVDGVDKNVSVSTGTSSVVRFILNNCSVRFRDLKIYPI